MQFEKWAFLVGALGVSVVPTAHAEPAPAGAVLQPAPLRSTAYCKQSTLTGVYFLRLIKTIVAHGNLTDVPFIENTLNAKFALSYYATTPDGKPDTEALFYHANGIFGSPITDALWIDGSKELQLRSGRIALMSIDAQSLPDLNSNFMRDCLHIPISSFYSFFGGHFFGGIINGRGAATRQITIVGKNQSIMSLNIGYDPEDSLVDHVGIDQRP
jgi:hypothetical protein